MKQSRPTFFYKIDEIQRDWELSLRYLPCLPPVRLKQKFESLKHEAFLLFNNMNENFETPQYVEIKNQLKTIEKTYIDGTHSTCAELSFYDRFENRSNNDCENINKQKIEFTEK